MQVDQPHLELRVARVRRARPFEQADRLFDLVRRAMLGRLAELHRGAQRLGQPTLEHVTVHLEHLDHRLAIGRGLGQRLRELLRYRRFDALLVQGRNQRRQALPRVFDAAHHPLDPLRRTAGPLERGPLQEPRQQPGVDRASQR